MDRQRARPSSPRPIVLIVDDDADTREVFTVGLSAFGFEATAVGDAMQAYTRARQTHPDIVMTDLSLPRIDGWKLLQHLKGDPKTRDIPVVFLTGHAQPSVRDRAKREGCAALFVKPCLLDALALALHNLIDGNPADGRAWTRS